MPPAKVFFYISLVLLPIQLNKYLFFENSLVLGIPIDYRALAIYLSDFAILATIVRSVTTIRREITAFIKANLTIHVMLNSLLLLLIINSIFFSTDTKVSLIHTLKIIEMSLYFTIAAYFLKDKQIVKSAQLYLKFSLVTQSFLAIAQFIFQRSIGLSLIGERTFDVGTSQIAQASFFGTELLRSYGSFPHPNILAAFLILTLAIVNVKPHLLNKRALSLSFLLKKNWLLLVVTAAIFTTFSKTGFILLLIYLTFCAESGKTKVIALVASVVSAFFYFNFALQTHIETIAERIQLTQAALTITNTNLLSGVGSNNFIVHLANQNIFSVAQVRLLQPVHNVFLLILAENGLAVFALFTFLLFKILENGKNKGKIFLSLALLTYLSIDHFFWTLHQGQMLFFITLAVIYSSKKGS